MQKQFFNFLPLYLAVIICAVSCADDTAIDHVLGSDSETPVFIAYKAVSGTEIVFEFSSPVKVISANLDSDDEYEPFSGKYDKAIELRFLSDHSGGRSITADLLVEDVNGNSLNVLVPFKTRNDNLPQLVINEIRLDYNKPSLEFIELRTLTAGNLGAMRLFAAAASIEEPIYEFPPVNVGAGEYIILHLRTLEGDTAIDELGDDLNLAKAAKTSDTNDDSRDLWVAGSTKHLQKSDVIYLIDQDNNVIDGIALAEDSTKWDKNKNLSKAAEFMAKQGAWLNAEGEAVKTPGYADTVSSNGTTLTQTLCRDETKLDSNTMKDWYVCARSSATPGGKNSEKRLAN